MLKKCDLNLIKFRSHVSNSELHKYGMDRSGTKVYKFNSLGYRGEEYDPTAKKRIFVCGCSQTFGTGLNIEESWPYQFKELFVQDKGIDFEDVNLLNFAAGGRSNDYISRTLMTQCNEVRPDLCIVYFTYMERSEHVDKEGPFTMGPWAYFEKKELGKLEPWARSEKVLSFYDYYTDELGLINLLKNMLLLQFFLKFNKVKYIFGSVHINNRLADKHLISNPVISQLIKLIDKKYLIPSKLEFNDHAADKKIEKGKPTGHAGPKSNKLFAKRLFRFYKKNIAH